MPANSDTGNRKRLNISRPMKIKTIKSAAIIVSVTGGVLAAGFAALGGGVWWIVLLILFISGISIGYIALIKKLNDGAFRGYAGERVVLPDGLEEIGQVNGEVFANCGKLTVWIPDSVTFIAPACFKNNTGYVIVQFEGTQAQYDALSKENIYEGLDWDNYQQPESFNVPRPEITIPMPS